MAEIINDEIIEVLESPEAEQQLQIPDELPLLPLRPPGPTEVATERGAQWPFRHARARAPARVSIAAQLLLRRGRAAFQASRTTRPLK